MTISYSKLFVGISLPALCTGLAGLILCSSANAQTIRPSTQKELKVFDPNASATGNIGIRAAAGTVSYTLTLPAAAPTANQVLSANAVSGGNVTLTWATPVSGTVTSVGLTAPTGFSVSNTPITSSGTLSLTFASGYSLPTTISQTTWTDAYNDRITAAAVTGTTTKTITLTQQDGGTITTSFSDAISLTTLGASGAATYSSTTGVLNIPTYTLTGLGGVGGSGTPNYLSKFATAGTLTNSLVFENGNNLGIGTAGALDNLTIGGASNGANLTFGLRALTPEGNSSRSVFTQYATSGGLLLAVDQGQNGNDRAFQLTVGPATNVLLMNKFGNVGIGTITPTARLEVRGAGTTSTTTALEVDNSDGSPLLTVRNDGNVGIGTTSPEAKIHSYGTASRNMFGVSTIGLPTNGDEEAVAVIKTNSLLWQMSLVGYGANSKGLRVYNHGGSGYTAFEVAQVLGTRFIVDGSGNVGIGTESPLGKVEVYDDTNGGIMLLTRDAGNLRGALKFGRHNSGTYQNVAQIDGASDSGSPNNGYVRGGASNSVGQIKYPFAGWGNTAGLIVGNTWSSAPASYPPPANGMIVEGNVGIGTASPAASLQVGTSISSAGTQTVRISVPAGAPGTVVNALHIDSNPSLQYTQGVALVFGRHHSTYNEYTSRIVHYGYSDYDRTSKLQLQTHSGIDGVWNTGILIDHVGNVGIGTITPTARLEVRGAGNTSATTALEVDNSDGTRLLAVRNDGSVQLGTNGTFFSSIIRATMPLNFNPTANGNTTQTFTVTGAKLGATVSVSPVNDLRPGVVIAWARVTANNLVAVSFYNDTNSTAPPIDASIYITVINP